MGFAKRIVCEGLSLYDRDQTYDAWERRMVESMGPEIGVFLRDAFQWVIIHHQTRLGAIGNKPNCWDVMRCRQRPNDGKRPHAKCSACNEVLLNGIHGGLNGGRACWAIDGTICGGKRQKSFINKQKMCYTCEFYREVMKEEGDHILSLDFMRMIIEFA